MKSVNQRIKELRDHLNLSQSDFAVQAMLSIGSVWNIENTNAAPSPRTLKAIIQAFNVNQEWLKTGKGEMFSPEKPAIQESVDPWETALIKELKEEVQYYRELLKLMASGGKANFRKALNYAALADQAGGLRARAAA